MNSNSKVKNESERPVKSTNDQNGTKSTFKDRKGYKNNNKNKEKFVPNFKKKTPTYKQIENELNGLLPKYDEIETSKLTKFEDFPLSRRTLDGLKKANYLSPTEIQRESIGIALKGYDLLGAAKTGSGKTLAFLIPILECLYRLKWTKYDGLGVLVISPTRELAYQTFEVLKKIGSFHDFSAGLVIGGKDLKTESKLISQTNIIICTPGRLLQHMDETWNFSCDNLKVLVLDEADRMLDLGFAETMNAILSNLPITRQTMLFSATQTKSVKDLARLSLKNPTYVSVHEHAAFSTPKNLIQTYVTCESHEKLSFLWSFIRNHLNQKIIVFFQSCKQVKFVYEAFSRMQTGMTTLCLYGTMNQLRRMQVYDDFCRKLHVILFATDVAARGLDFPSINWVVQMDCPPDANTYIHRVGRTARYEKDGQAILVLTPHEETEMMNELNQKKIPISEIKVNMKRIVNIDSKMQSLCAGDVDLKESAKRALMAYLRSIFLMSNKKIFNIENIDIVKFSSSLGLVVAPKIRFLKRAQSQAKNQENAKLKKMIESSQEEDDDDDDGEEKDNEEANNKLSSEKSKSKLTLKKKLLLKKKAVPVAGESEEPLNFSKYTHQNDDEDDGLFTVKKIDTSSQSDDDDNHQFDNILTKNKLKIKTKASLVKKLKKKNIKINEKVLFDEDGNRIINSINVPKSVNITEELAKELEDKTDKTGYSGINIEEAKNLLKNEDQFDKQLYRDRIKKMHREKRLKEKDLRRAKRQKPNDDEPGLVQLKTDSNFDDDNDFDQDSDE